MYENYKVINLLKIWQNHSDVVNVDENKLHSIKSYPKIVCGWGSTPDPAEELETPRLSYDKLRRTLEASIRLELVTPLALLISAPHAKSETTSLYNEISSASSINLICCLGMPNMLRLQTHKYWHSTLKRFANLLSPGPPKFHIPQSHGVWMKHCPI